MTRFKNKGQSFLEYPMLVICIAAAFITMQFYIKRAVQGRVKQAGDEISEPYDSAAMETSTITTTITANTTVNSTRLKLYDDAEGYPVYGIKVNTTQNESISRTGEEKIGDWGSGSLTDDPEPEGD